MPSFGVVTPNYGEYGDVHVLVELARLAEENGWDGFFCWDHMYASFGDPVAMADPWVALAAAAVATLRVKLGTWVTPIARRRPWKLARETVSLDRLSGGRLILGVGLGAPAEMEYGAFGEDTDARVRAAKLDEGLEVLTGLWRDGPLSFSGEHFQVTNVDFLPKPVQSPRIPIWVAGEWPHKPPFRRAARWDGATPLSANLGWDELIPVSEVREVASYVREHRTGTAPFDLVITGPTEPGTAGAATLAPYVEAGMTWWLEGCHHRRGALADTVARIKAGPPRL